MADSLLDDGRHASSRSESPTGCCAALFQKRATRKALSMAVQRTQRPATGKRRERWRHSQRPRGRPGRVQSGCTAELDAATSRKRALGRPPAKRGRLRNYAADELRERKNDIHAFAFTIHNKCLVDEPCELGCDDLSYCTHFNRRPAELFHSCNARSDKTAEADVRLWSQGLIRLPVMDIPVRNVSTCPPEAWKAVACTLQLKPCHRHDHASAICKDDCVDILNRCVDPSRLKEFETPYTLCEALAPPGENPPCISLRPYLEMSKLEANVREVTHPCRAHTCNASSICILKRKCSDKDYPCSKYQCVSGKASFLRCLVGEASKTIVPRGTFVSIPTLAHDSKCSMVCRCSNTGTLQDCTPQPCTGTDEPCWLGGRKYGLPCSCPKDYFAVCGSNGKTYPNACLARCAGLSPDQYKIGVCFDMDPCASNPCPRNTRCIVNRKVCLVRGYDVCKQYICGIGVPPFRHRPSIGEISSEHCPGRTVG
ncbi:hypothetical protein HPB47_027865 [Ixodes persulcatus]|uniref:Uncharacterized protein n=1 Tax=Ixodes persulcatus TaxID=34615 RepID=A0AC60PWA1_IXOPE|nr:hypothetical protein HPB47_027865 [Ixodes persulcatus]